MTQAPRSTIQRRGRSGSADLPTYYYHTHFVEMLAFVCAHYPHVLSHAERQFQRDFCALSLPAQRLYVRLANRRGRLFKGASLRYPEIASIPMVLSELAEKGFISSPNASHRDELLRLLTRPQLVSALKAASINVTSALKKAEVIALAKDSVSADLLLAAIPLNKIVVQCHFETVRFLLFLYFGELQDSLSQFTLRDLGLVRTQSSSVDYEPRFSEREDAEQAYYFARRLEKLQRGESAAQDIYLEIASWPKPSVSTVADLRDALVLKLGRQLESDTDAALAVYQQGESVDCSERIIRLLLTSGRRKAAKDYLEQCIASPSSDEQALLASDIYHRKFHQKRTSVLTDLLRDAPSIDIDDAHRGAPEWAAVAYFEKQGKRAFRAENRFWRMLFGLLFWDLIFESEASAMGSPFERLPTTLTNHRFGTIHHAAIEERLLLLENRQAAQRHVLRNSAKYFGIPNGLFRWRQPTLDAIHAYLAVAPASATAQVLRRFCDDYLSAKHGYPDLLVIEDSSVRFIEIKAEGDQLRRNQLLRLMQLQDAGFDASVMRVRWVLDPAQAYVVVDVETTGGKSTAHRITEIGAVKIVGDSIVDTFHTLINPQRPIPKGITSLTGISDAMVASAPLFADVADAFSSFCSDAIFVAHNVEFDYGFVVSEFERLGKGFRRPKLCTCASMRKLFIGKDSYSLAALCSDYQIPLRRHHRALYDAEAAAELLLIINAKRRELLNEQVTNLSVE